MHEYCIELGESVKSLSNQVQNLGHVDLQPV